MNGACHHEIEIEDLRDEELVALWNSARRLRCRSRNIIAKHLNRAATELLRRGYGNQVREAAITGRIEIR